MPRYLALFVAAVSIYFTSGDQPLALAAWLSPVFLLRFTRTGRPWQGYLGAVAVYGLARMAGNWGMSPIPVATVVVSNHFDNRMNHC